MILKWIRSVTQGANPAAAKQADEEERKGRRETKLVDLAHEALAKQAASDSNTLDALVRMGMPHIQRERLKSKVRQKVWDVVSGESGFTNSEMIEEITERLVDVAEVDPFYKKMFDREET